MSLKQSYLVLFFLFGSGAGYHTIAGDSTFFSDPGKVYGVIYSNFHTGLGESNDDSGFEIKRGYLGYRKNLSKHFSANVKLDIGSPEDLSEYSLIRRYAYFKNAYLKYQNKKFSALFGIIDMLYIKIHEKYWVHRYIEKAFADSYRFGFAADLGAQAIYQWTDWLSADLTISNGEGYTRLQADNTYITSIGVTCSPGYNIVTRLYYDYSHKTNMMSTASVFLGYKMDNKVIGGIEYHYRLNDDFLSTYNRYGYSAYLSCYIFKKWQLFGRYDKVLSNIPENREIPWNLGNDGTKIIGGIEYAPIKYVKLALNYQDWFPYAKNETNSQYIYFNVEVSF